MNQTHITHIWAHNEDPNRSRRSGNMSFDGMSLYSYGTVIAVKYPKQKTCLMAGEGIYNSTTTAKHKSQARYALSIDWTIVTVNIPISDYAPPRGRELESITDLRECHDYMVKQLQSLAKAVLVARRGKSQLARMDEFERALSEVNGLGHFLGRKPVTQERAGLKMELQESLRAAEKVQRAKDKVAREAKEAEQRLNEQEASDKWKRHELSSGYYANWEGTYLRLTVDGSKVQTSRGVTITIEEALKAYRICAYVASLSDFDYAKRLQQIQPVIHTIAGYGFKGISHNGDCTIGCHHLTFSEMERIYNEAKTRGLLETKETNT